MKSPSVSVKISNGEATWIYSDDMKDLLNEGPSVVKRVSHVEPVKTFNHEGQHSFVGWEARMEDGTVLGPFESREDALTAERAYLEEKMFK